MDITGTTIIVTGGANGIGAAMVRRFVGEGAATVLVADLDGPAAERLACELDPSRGGRVLALRADVRREEEVAALVGHAVKHSGRLDLFCSNAGVIVQGGPESPDADWSLAWEVNMMAHVHAARHALPVMLSQGQGYFLNTCSSAGLLTALGAAPYAVTKSAAIAFAEWLAITYGAEGIRVSALCPQAVRTRMIEEAGQGSAGSAVKSAGTLIEPDDVAERVMQGLADERFLIFTHPETEEFVQRKGRDRDRWIGGMRKFAQSV